MKKVFKVLLWIVGVVVVLFIIGFFLPAKRVVERTVVIDSKPETVYAWVNDLKTYDKWMPWNRIDTAMVKEYGPQTSGQGAWYKWQSANSNVGHGKLTITESVPAQKVVTKLEFADYDPAYGGWLITPSAGGSSVKWYMENNMGTNPAMRWMCLIMDKVLGAQFEKGLDSLKSAIKKDHLETSEKEPRMEAEEISTQAMNVITILDTASSPEEIGSKLAKDYTLIGAEMKAQKLKMQGPPMAWYRSQEPPFFMEAGTPVTGTPKKPKAPLKLRTVAGTSAVVVHFWGPYEQTPKAYKKIAEWLKQHGKSESGAPYEVYVTDPTTVKDPYQVQTDVYQPVK